MPRRDVKTVTALVLRKTAYGDTSLIVATLTDDGQQHFILRGARKTGKRAFPAIDLFREVQLTYVPSTSSDLHTATSADCLQPFSGISRRPAHYEAAGWLARFALANHPASDPAPQLYTALRSAFVRLDAAALASCLPVVLGVCFTAAAEHGVLPESASCGNAEHHVARVLACAADPAVPYPDYGDEVWRNLRDWLRDLLLTSHLRVPATLDKIN